MAAHASIFAGEILLVLGSEFGIESNRMAATAGNWSFLTDIIVVTIGTFITVLIRMDKMSKNHPSATVVHNDPDRIFLHRRRKKKSCYSRYGQNSNN